jgi:hypothetical protein
MSEKLFIDGDSVLFMSVPGQPLKKFLVVSAIWDKSNNVWNYKLKDMVGNTISNVSEKQLTMD